MSLSLALALSLGAAAPTAAAPAPLPPTLTGEALSGGSSSGNSPACPIPTFAVNGTATGPYPGTFSEAGTLSSVQLSTTFSIMSGSLVVTGTKTVPSAIFFTCSPFGFGVSINVVPYTAMIHTPTGNFRDEGVSTFLVEINGSAAILSETYTSLLAQPVLIVPITKDQCKDGGWHNFPQFNNQGQCVSFLERNP
jgi:hypothetical protein